MSIGAGIFLFVIGAILAFAVNGASIAGVVSLPMIGYILMVAGVIIFILGMVFTFRKRQSISTSRVAVDPVSGESVNQRETTVRNDAPLL